MSARAPWHRNIYWVAGIAIATGSLVSADQVRAQAAGPTTPPTRGELIPPEQRRDRSGPSLTIDSEMERAPCALDREEYSNIRFTLSRVDFVGLEKVPGVSLSDTYASYLNRDVPLAVLCDIRENANRALRDEGYLATVEIAEQNLSDGSAEFRIVFGRLTTLRVRGEAGPSEALVASYLEKLTGQPVFDIKEAERYLLLADDLPGVDVRLSLRPAANGEPGDLAGEIAVIRRRGVLDFNMQNYGSKAIGRFGGLLRGELYDLTGLGDRTSLAVYSTAEFKEQQTIQAAHEFRVGSEGMKFGAQFTYSVTNPDVSLAGFEIESETILATVVASYPIKRTRNATIMAEAGIDIVNQDVDLNNFSLTKDRVRTVFARFNGAWTDEDSIARRGGYTFFEPRTRLTLGLEARQGIDMLGASPDCRANLIGCIFGGIAPPSRIEADPTPFLVRAEAGAEFRPIPNIAFVLQAEAQVSSAPLPAFEEFAAGNYSIGRGYDPGAVLGDNGVGVSLEIRHGSLAPKSSGTFAVQPYVFTDAAWAWNKDPSRRPLNPDRLWSVGGGVRAALGSRLQADLSVAVPLNKPDLAPNRGDVRVMFSLTARLFPWRY
jgi:hemolysin activation/secretion protein